MILKCNYAIIFYFAIFVILQGCSGVRSGRYVKIERSLQQTATDYAIDIETLKKVNPGKSLTAGSVIFIPQSVGVIPALNTHIYGSAYIPPKSAGSGDYIWPVPGVYRISSNYGKRGRKHHDGIDIAAPTGTTIVASSTGKVVFSGRMSGYGNIVILSHGKEIFTVYAHASRLLVKKGQQVKQGQKIAKVGSTGRSTGPHLHFEIRKKNKHLDPLTYIPAFRSIASNRRK